MEELHKKIISNRIKFLLTKFEIKSETLAYRAGLSKSCLSEIINGKKTPKSLTIAMICAGFNIKLSDFYNFEEIDNFVEKYSSYTRTVFL